MRLAATVLLATAAMAGASGTGRAAGPIAIVGPDNLVITAPGGYGTATVAVANDGPEVAVTWSIAPTQALQTNPAGASASTVTVTPALSRLASNSVTRVELAFTVTNPHGAVKGYLVGTSTGSSAPASVPFTIATSIWNVSLPAAWLIVVVLVIALLVVFGTKVAWQRFVAKGAHTDDWDIGNPKFDFTNSWASTLTSVGGLLALVAASGMLPGTQVLLDKTEFAALTLVFAAFALLAPIANVTLKGVPGVGGGVGTFVFAAWLTTAGVIGQLATLGLLLADSLGQAGTNEDLLNVVGLIWLVSEALVVTYVVRSTVKVLSKAKAHQRRETTAAEHAAWHLF